jgi:hypothetical protein
LADGKFSRTAWTAGSVNKISPMDLSRMSRMFGLTVIGNLLWCLSWLFQSKQNLNFFPENKFSMNFGWEKLQACWKCVIV